MLRLLFCILPCTSNLLVRDVINRSFVGAVEGTQYFLPNRASEAEDTFPMFKQMSIGNFVHIKKTQVHILNNDE